MTSLAVTLLVPSHRRKVGGSAVLYEWANGLCRLGAEVHVVHFRLFETSAARHEITWFEFEEGIHHHGPFDPPLLEQLDAGEPTLPDQLPSADVAIGYYRNIPPSCGLTAIAIQGYRMLTPALEEAAFRFPCLKLCVASWLVDVGHSLGVSPAELAHIPNGIDHARFRVTRDPAERPPRVAMLHHAHANKGVVDGLSALEEVRESHPALDVILFGNEPTRPTLPEWVTYFHDPEPSTLVDEIYNTTRIFLCPSRTEGFGLTSLEAMACGAALVTTDNGGSRDYAFHDRTALVSAPNDISALADNVAALLDDEVRRLALVDGGLEQAATFTWERSAASLWGVLDTYRHQPTSFGWRPG